MNVKPSNAEARDLRGEPPTPDLRAYAARLAAAFLLPYDGTRVDAERVLADVERLARLETHPPPRCAFVWRQS